MYSDLSSPELMGSNFSLNVVSFVFERATATAAVFRVAASSGCGEDVLLLPTSYSCRSAAFGFVETLASFLFYYFGRKKNKIAAPTVFYRETTTVARVAAATGQHERTEGGCGPKTGSLETRTSPKSSRWVLQRRTSALSSRTGTNPSPA